MVYLNEQMILLRRCLRQQTDLLQERDQIIVVGLSANLALAQLDDRSASYREALAGGWQPRNVARVSAAHDPLAGYPVAGAEEGLHLELHVGAPNERVFYEFVQFLLAPVDHSS